MFTPIMDLSFSSAPFSSCLTLSADTPKCSASSWSVALFSSNQRLCMIYLLRSSSFPSAFSRLESAKRFSLASSMFLAKSDDLSSR